MLVMKSRQLHYVQNCVKNSLASEKELNDKSAHNTRRRREQAMILILDKTLTESEYKYNIYKCIYNVGRLVITDSL